MIDSKERPRDTRTSIEVDTLPLPKFLARFKSWLRGVGDLHYAA